MSTCNDVSVCTPRPVNAATAGQRIPVVAPATEVREAEDHFRVTLAMPGVARDAIAITVDGEDLVVEGTYAWNPPTGQRVVVQEFGAVTYRRRLLLPESVDRGAISAQADAGLLHLKLPKVPAATPRRIAVA